MHFFANVRCHMKIAMIGQKGLPAKFGGIETHVTELSTRLVRAGHDVVAYARPWYADEKIARYNGVAVKYLPSIRSKHLDAISHTFFATVHACLFFRPTVIHFHGVGPSLLAWIPRILRPQAVVISTFHCVDSQHDKWGAFARFMLRLGERASIKFAHTTIAVSKSLTNYIALGYGKRARYIPNGVAVQRVATDDVVIDPFSLRSGDYIAMVSRLVKHKGAHTLIAAWQLAREKRPELLKDTKLAIVGGSAFTDHYVKDLHSKAQGDASIVFTGYQSGAVLKALFAGAKFAVHPSVSEGLPIAVLEAMSYGKAVIASDIAENMEIVADYGVPFAAGNVDELSEKIIELAEDPMTAASIGHMAREFVESEYNWDDIALETINVYRESLALRSGILATP